MSTASLAYRLSATTGMHRGDRAYQQDQVEILPHDRVPGCLLAVLADGMGGKSGGRKAADQVLLTARQLFERFSPSRDDTAETLSRTIDHSYVQRLVDEGQITEEEANSHPQSNLLTGCLGTHQDPPITQKHIDKLEIGDSVLSCSDGLWHYFTPRELGAIVHALPPREATEMLVGKARQRARGSGDNLSLALVRVEPLAARVDPAAAASRGARGKP